jgi:hypothetical protein
VSSAVLSTAAAPTCIYRSNLPPPTAAELATRKKLGPDAVGGSRACFGKRKRKVITRFLFFF